MHINMIPMFYLTCKNFPLILTLKGVGFINRNFPLQTQFKGFLKKTLLIINVLKSRPPMVDYGSQQVIG